MKNMKAMNKELKNNRNEAVLNLMLGFKKNKDDFKIFKNKK